MTRIALAAVALGCIALPAAAQNMAVEMANVPAGLAAVAMTAGQVEAFESVNLEIEQGHPVYEFKGKGADGAAFEVDVLANGMVEEIEHVIAVDAAPAEVKDALGLLAGFTPAEAEMSLRADGTEVYEFGGQIGGKDVDVDVSADGRTITVSDDSAG